MSNETIVLSRTRGKTKRRFNKRLSIWLLALALVCCAGIGGVYALSMHKVGQENVLQSHNTSVRIDETFPSGQTVVPGETRTKQVKFTNTGSSPVFLRVAYSETWENAIAGTWLEDDGTHAIKNWTPAWASDWVLLDGWYYYKKVLPAGGSTDDILSSVSFPPDLAALYSAGTYKLSFLAEAVQLSDEDEVNMQATQAVFGRKPLKINITSTSKGAVTAGTIEWS